jgi:hypothetical protein
MCYAHVPDINDFTQGLQAALKEGGTITLEFPHLMRLIEFCQFDTVYHEHFSYLSLYTVSRIFAAAGLRVCRRRGAYPPTAAACASMAAMKMMRGKPHRR